jgi:hypothetical protein
MNGPMTDLWQVLLILINGPIIFLSMLINGPMAGAANTNEWAHYISVNACEGPMAGATVIYIDGPVM